MTTNYLFWTRDLLIFAISLSGRDLDQVWLRREFGTENPQRLVSLGLSQNTSLSTEGLGFDLVMRGLLRYILFLFLEGRMLRLEGKNLLDTGGM